MDAAEFLRLKNALEQHKRDLERRRGRLETLLDQLRKKYGTDNVARAGKLLTRKRTEADELAATYRNLMEEYEKRWGDRLGS